MEQILNTLGQMLLRATPTFVLVLLLYVFLKKVFFNPLEKILHQRHSETEGAVKAAQDAMAAAEKRTAEYHQALQDARSGIYRMQEQDRQKTVEENAARTRDARTRAEERLRAARAELQAETEQAKMRLSQEAGELAESITRTVFRPRAETAP